MSIRRKGTVLAGLMAGIAIAGCASTDTTSRAPTDSSAAATVTHTVTSPAAASVPTTTSAPKPKPKPKHKAKLQTFNGSADENVGSIKVDGPSTLIWQCASCGGGNFIIENNDNDDNQLDVNALDQTSGSTYVDAGTYTDVSIATEGQAWTFTIKPGNSTQRAAPNVTPEIPTPTQTDPPVAPPTTTPEPAAPATPTSPVGSPLGTVNDYWAAINSGDYARAWSDLAPGAGASSASAFAASEEQDGVSGASFDGEVSSLDGDSASVNVDSLITQDSAGCQSWTGTYQLSDEGGSWLITHAAISQQPCEE